MRKISDEISEKIQTFFRQVTDVFVKKNQICQSRRNTLKRQKMWFLAGLQKFMRLFDFQLFKPL